MINEKTEAGKDTLGPLVRPFVQCRVKWEMACRCDLPQGHRGFHECKLGHIKPYRRGYQHHAEVTEGRRDDSMQTIVRFLLLLLAVTILISGWVAQWRGFWHGFGGGMCLVLTIWSYIELRNYFCKSNASNEAERRSLANER